MPPMTLREFLVGRPAYAPLTEPKLYVGGPIAVTTVILSQLAAGYAFLALGFSAADLAAPADVTPASGPAPAPSGITHGQLLIVLISQAFMIALTLSAAYASQKGTSLRLGEPEGGRRAYLWAIVAMIPLLAVMNGAFYVLNPDAYLNDFRQFLATVRSPWPVIALLAICIGAPLSEELLFRGYLLTSATTTRMPFWVAAIIVNLAWTALHVQYSWIGMVEVFVIGLYLCWLTWRTGSLRVPLACHAAYNTSLFLIMRLAPVA